MCLDPFEVANSIGTRVLTAVMLRYVSTRIAQHIKLDVHKLMIWLHAIEDAYDAQTAPCEHPSWTLKLLACCLLSPSPPVPQHLCKASAAESIR